MDYPHRHGMMSGQENFAIWEGVYSAWEDAPETGAAFASDKWLDDQAQAAMVELRDYQDCQDAIKTNAKSSDYILSTVVAMAGSDGAGTRVLDFGGGMATAYLPLVASLPDDFDLDFHVVEHAGVCERGRQIYPEAMKVFFHEELPDDNRFEVIHAGRSFQYVDDWRGLLKSFARLSSGYLILAGALAGNIPSFVSIQNYYDHGIRVRFLNLDELLLEAANHGFQLISKSRHLSVRLGKTGPLPMQNFPPAQQLDYPCQLLFKMGQA